MVGKSYHTCLVCQPGESMDRSAVSKIVRSPNPYGISPNPANPGLNRPFRPATGESARPVLVVQGVSLHAFKQGPTENRQDGRSGRQAIREAQGRRGAPARQDCKAAREHPRQLPRAGRDRVHGRAEGAGNRGRRHLAALQQGLQQPRRQVLELGEQQADGQQLLPLRGQPVRRRLRRMAAAFHRDCPGQSRRGGG